MYCQNGLTEYFVNEAISSSSFNVEHIFVIPVNKSRVNDVERILYPGMRIGTTERPIESID